MSAEWRRQIVRICSDNAPLQGERSKHAYPNAREDLDIFHFCSNLSKELYPRHPLMGAAFCAIRQAIFELDAYRVS